MPEIDSQELLEIFRVWKHDGFTPLTAIKGYTKLLMTPGLLPGELSEQHKQLLEVIYRNSMRASTCWDDAARYLNFRYGEPRIDWKAWSFTDLVKLALADLQGYEIGEVRKEFPEDLPALRAADWLAYALAYLLFPGPALPLLETPGIIRAAHENGCVVVRLVTRLQAAAGDAADPGAVLERHPGSRLSTAALIVRKLYGTEVQARHTGGATEFELSIPVWS